MIEARDPTKDYGKKRAVDGLSFTVGPGIVTGFLGPNGSGKSTLTGGLVLAAYCVAAIAIAAVLLVRRDV